MFKCLDKKSLKKYNEVTKVYLTRQQMTVEQIDPNRLTSRNENDGYCCQKENLGREHIECSEYVQMSR